VPLGRNPLRSNSSSVESSVRSTICIGDRLGVEKFDVGFLAPLENDGSLPGTSTCPGSSGLPSPLVRSMTGTDRRGNVASLGETLLTLPESLDLLTNTSTSPEGAVNDLFPGIVVVIAATEYETGESLEQGGEELACEQSQPRV
jgi:hypothetical protein